VRENGDFDVVGDIRPKVVSCGDEVEVAMRGAFLEIVCGWLAAMKPAKFQGHRCISK
jgi:hypothetical protein